MTSSRYIFNRYCISGDCLALKCYRIISRHITTDSLHFENNTDSIRCITYHFTFSIDITTNLHFQCFIIRIHSYFNVKVSISDFKFSHNLHISIQRQCVCRYFNLFTISATQCHGYFFCKFTYIRRSKKEISEPIAIRRNKTCICISHRSRSSTFTL